MAAPPPHPPKGDRPEPSKETIERERIEKMTLSIRSKIAGGEPAGAPAKEKLREYRARAVLSYHRFLGRWTAP